MGRRFKIKGKPNSFAERDGKGQFKNWTGIGRSIAQDRRIKAKRTVKAGYGHLGDQKKRLSLSNSFKPKAYKPKTHKPNTLNLPFFNVRKIKKILGIA